MLSPPDLGMAVTATAEVDCPDLQGRSFVPGSRGEDSPVGTRPDSLPEIEVLVADVRRRDAVLAHQLLNVRQQTPGAAECDVYVAWVVHCELGESPREIGTGRAARYGLQFDATLFRSLR